MKIKRGMKKKIRKSNDIWGINEVNEMNETNKVNE